MRIQSVFYNNPDYYPPMINGAYIIGSFVQQHDLIVRDYEEPILPQSNILYPSNTRVIRLSASSSASSLLEYVRFILRVLSKAHRNTDVVIGYDAHGLIAAWLLARFTGKPLVYHCHDYTDDTEAYALSQKIIKWAERKMARTARVVVIPDQERAQIMVKQLKLPNPPIIAANSPLFAPQSSSLLQDTLRLSGKSFSRVVFRPGRIGPNHALDVTLRSMPMWSETSWGFVIMGPADIAYCDYLTDLAAELGVADRFVILSPVSYSEVAQYTVGADLGHGLYEPNHVNNRYITTASNKIMEYIAAGLPVLLSESQGSRNLLERYKLGITADVASPEAIATAINRIFSDPQAIDAMRAESRHAFEQELNYQKQYAPVIEKIYEFASGQRRQYKK
jgi:glycosyltransferase involved in cell wall biosynthesis